MMVGRTFQAGGGCKCKQKADWEEGVTVLPALRDLLGQEPQEKLGTAE